MLLNKKNLIEKSEKKDILGGTFYKTVLTLDKDFSIMGLIEFINKHKLDKIFLNVDKGLKRVADHELKTPSVLGANYNNIIYLSNAERINLKGFQEVIFFIDEFDFMNVIIHTVDTEELTITYKFNVYLEEGDKN